MDYKNYDYEKGIEELAFQEAINVINIKYMKKGVISKFWKNLEGKKDGKKRKIGNKQIREGKKNGNKKM